MGIFDIFSNSDANNAAQAQQQGYQQGYGQLSQLFGQGNQALQGNYQAAAQPSQTNYGYSGQGVTQLLAALGLGPQGSAGISQTLQNTPGYQFTLDQGSQNVLRNQAATGQLNSGATDIALQNLGQGTAQQYYQNYVNSLQPFLGYSTNSANTIGGLYSGLGNALNANLTGQGNAAYGSSVGQGNAQAQADYSKLASSGNFWNMLGGLAGGGLKLLGSA